MRQTHSKKVWSLEWRWTGFIVVREVCVIITNRATSLLCSPDSFSPGGMHGLGTRLSIIQHTVCMQPQLWCKTNYPIASLPSATQAYLPVTRPRWVKSSLCKDQWGCTIGNYYTHFPYNNKICSSPFKWSYLFWAGLPRHVLNIARLHCCKSALA